jgi:photosystem II stability/assembly factor-like uncharacterized protein
MRISFVVLAVYLLAAVARVSAQELPLAELARQTHFHGLAIDPTDSGRALLATHHGLFAITRDGRARRVSQSADDLMGFTAHPADPTRLLASGHPASGGNLGVVESSDGGRTWRQISPGLRGPVDFHQMTVSRADPNVVYGVHEGVQVSRDGGRTWTMSGAAPPRLISLAASAEQADQLYAATEAGLMVSRDAGRSWAPTDLSGPTSTVHVAADGALYAFVLGRGLLRREKDAQTWQVAGSFGARYVLHLASGPQDRQVLLAVLNDHSLLRSEDRGRTWAPFVRAQ